MSQPRFRGVKQVRELYPRLVVWQTQDLVIDLIRSTALSVREADAIKQNWATNHRFRLKEFASFADLLARRPCRE